MKKNVLTRMSAAMALTFMVSAVGCNSTTPPPAPASPVQSTAPQTSAEVQTTETPGADAPIYPLNTNVKLDYWCELQSNYSSYAPNFGDTEFAKEWQKRLGVDITFIQPPQGGSQEAFNVLVASGNYPDIIEWNWVGEYPGGSTAAIEDKVIIRLNEPIEKWAPNYQAYLDTHPDFVKQVKNDNGDHFVFPFIRGADKLKSTSGLMLRKDWLDELQLEVPETVDEWENVLTQFKEKKGATAPFTSQSANALTGLYDGLLASYNVRKDIYMENNVVKYGFAEEGYKEFITKMADWYKKGLIDPNYLTVDRKTMDAQMLNGQSGAAYAPGGGAMGPWITTGQSTNPAYDLVAAKYAVKNKGELTSYGGTSYDFTMASKAMGAITTKAKDVEVATRVLDYAFSPEGHLLFNFGIEGVSYNMVDGVPTYADDIIFHNPDGLTIAQAISKYARGNMNGPFAQDEGYIIQYYTMPQQKNALEQWTAQNNPVSTLLPPVSLTPEESSEQARLKTELDTYVKESSARFINGLDSLDNWDAYIAQLEKMQYKRLIEINQAALERYNKR